MVIFVLVCFVRLFACLFASLLFACLSVHFTTEYIYFLIANSISFACVHFQPTNLRHLLTLKLVHNVLLNSDSTIRIYMAIQA